MSRHALLMVLCCAIPLALIWALPYLGITPSTTMLLVLVIVLCPVLHFLFMRGHGHGHDYGSPGDESDHRRNAETADRTGSMARHTTRGPARPPVRRP